MPAASDASSRVTTGSTSRLGSSSGLLPGGTIATGGNQRSATKNTATSSEAITNSGIEIATSEPSEIAWSVGLPDADRGQHPQSERQRNHQHRRDRGEDQRVLQRPRDQVPDRSALGPLRERHRRVAQVAVDEPAQPVEVARHQRLIEMHLVLEDRSPPGASRFARARRWQRCPGSTCSATKIKIDAASKASRAPTIRRPRKRGHRRGRARAAGTEVWRRLSSPPPHTSGEPGVRLVTPTATRSGSCGYRESRRGLASGLWTFFDTPST